MISNRGAERLVGAAAIALLLEVDVATLERWHAHHAGPPAATGGHGLVYSRPAVEAWRNRIIEMPVPSRG